MRESRIWIAVLVALVLPLGLTLMGCGGGSSGGGGATTADVPDDGTGTGGDTGGEVVDDARVAELLTIHTKAFTEDLPAGYEGAHSCVGCHPDAGSEFMASAHWNWQGVASNMEGHEGEVHGKADLINNFCIAIPSNEGRCTQCHAGYGWSGKNYDFANLGNVDCLVCHDTSGTYAKDPKTAGLPVATVDLQVVAKHVGEPTRKNCGACHFFAGGGDNVKHGDLSSDLISPTREMDVHMGLDGGDFSCQKCHKTEDHGIAGMPLHSTHEGEMDCTDCHDAKTVHERPELAWHSEKVACQTCHIPTFARSMPTKVEWYWADAGQDIADIPVDQYGKPLYDKMKGTFVWAKSVKPDLRWFNGKWNRFTIGANDKYDTLPAILAEPVGSRGDPGSKLYPFKRMIGNQPADKLNKTILVPHLFGKGPGPSPFWGAYDWGKAIEEGAAWAGQPYSGEFEFVNTVMYLTVNHEIAPKEMALKCFDCHNGGIDFKALGYPRDPYENQ